MRRALSAVVFFVLAGCASTGSDVTNLDLYGERFVHLALELGQHDSDYVDAYFGPEQWRRDAAENGRDLEQLRADASDAAGALSRARTDSARNERRRIYLARQFAALSFRARMLLGDRYSFDEESRGLYDAVAPRHDATFFQATLDELDRLLPGSGEIAARREAFRKNFEIAPERLDEVFQTAIAECARRTRMHVALPENESFSVEYVTDKAWSGYNWYQGDARSLIQVNTDFPIYIDRAIDLACHEGYPGHHVLNTLLEQKLLNELGWIEFSVFPLFSPIGPIAEGSANYGIVMAFPGDERIEYEREVLFGKAGLDPAQAERYYAVEELVDRLSYAGNEAARRYIDGEIDTEQAVDWLMRYALMSRERAQQRVRFIDKYGAYVINYNLGRDLVAAWVERVGPDQDARWARFIQLLSTPNLPSQLTQ